MKRSSGDRKLREAVDRLGVTHTTTDANGHLTIHCNTDRAKARAIREGRMNVDTDTGELIESETALGKLTSDCQDLLAEHLPLVQRALANTHCEEPASITIKVAWKPAKEGTENREGEPFTVEVSAKAQLPSQRIKRKVSQGSVRESQMVLFEPR